VNPIYNSALAISSSGETLKIFATKYYFGIIKYQTPTLLYTNVNLVCEFQRDDLWNVSPYVPVTSLGAQWYVPRLKTDIAVDTTGTGSYLVDCPEIWDSSGTKQLIDDNGVTYNAQTDVRLVGPHYNRLVMGGKLLGGIKRTTNGYGSLFDEMTINNITYINIPLNSKTYLIPKG
jgi:hypothetical protein